MTEPQSVEEVSATVAAPELPQTKSSFWFTEHSALMITTAKWALLGALAGLCVGFGTKIFLYLMVLSTREVRHFNFDGVRYFDFLPIALPGCVWLIRTFAPTAKGHGTEAVIAAVHNRSGKIDLPVAPVKLVATLLTLAFGGSVGKEGPCAQIGASIASGFADLLRLSDADRRRLVICGIGAGFAAVFGTPVSGALFGIEVLALGRIEYPVLFPCLVAGIVAHLVCGGSPPVAAITASTGKIGGAEMVALALLFGVVFGLAARVTIAAMSLIDRLVHPFQNRPYLVAAFGGFFLCGLYHLFGQSFAGLGLPTIDQAMRGSATIALSAFAIKIVATSVTLETGGSGGIVTPLFFIGSTLGASIASHLGLPPALFAAFGFIAVVAAAANTPIAASVMAIELLPPTIGVYAALCACTAYLIVGHNSVYKSQLVGFSKSGGLYVPLDIAIGELKDTDIHTLPGSLAERFNNYASRPIRRIRIIKQGSFKK